MICPNHITRSASGYCYQCGSFFCDECLTEHEGNRYCPKHYKPFAQKLREQQQREEIRRRHARHSLVVHFKDGRRAQGVCHTMNIREAGFHLEVEDDNGVATGQTQRIRFADVKSVNNVKSYDGKFDPAQSFQEYAPGGTRLVVEFQDGEVVEGATLQHYDPDSPRFYLIPLDKKSNNINVLVEQSAVRRVYTPQEWKAHQEAEREAKQAAKQERKSEAAVLGQEETLGDFYFEQHNYATALEHYDIAWKKFPDSNRIKRKVLVSTLNIGIGHVKKRDYPTALHWMEKALEIDPENPHAKKKSKQLRKIIDKTQKRMQAYYEGKLGEGKGE